MLKMHSTPKNVCPGCGAGLDTASSINNKGEGPKPGDFSMCLYCRAFLVFNDDFTTRLTNDGDFAEMPDELRDLLLRLRRALRSYSPSKKPPIKNGPDA